MQWPHFCSLFFWGTLSTQIPQPEDDPYQQLRGTWPAAVSGGELAASLWQSSSGEQGQGSSPFSPLLQFTAAPLAFPASSGLWAGAWTPEQGVPPSCARALAGSQALARRLSCCWPAHSDSLALATSSCFLIWIPVPPLCFGGRARTILCPCLLLLLWLIL